MKHLIIFIKRKQYLAIQDWPGYKNNTGISLSQSIFNPTLKIIKVSAELNGITEEIVRGDFFNNLRNSFDMKFTYVFTEFYFQSEFYTPAPNGNF